MKSARKVAFEVIYNTHKKKSYANLLLPKVLSRTKLSSKDKSLVTELVYGTLRMQGTLDWALSLCTSRELENVDGKTLDILRLGAYQILFLDKIPEYAACSESVEIAKRSDSYQSAKFINAVLRKLAREKDELPYPKREDDSVGYLTFKYSHPRWLVEMWKNELGLKETELLCKANNRRPKLVIRTNTLKTTTSGLLDYLKKEGVRAKRSLLLEGAVIIENSGDVSRLPGFSEGLFQVQDEASILAGYAVDPQPEETILDVCAAPGGKTTHLAQLMNNRGTIFAVDIYPQRLKLIKESCLRLGVDIVRLIEADATRLDEVLKQPVARALVDAPCSGLGALMRRPDARWQKNLSNIKELADLQLKLLRSTARFIKPGGTLVYSVCTISKSESTDVAHKFLDENPKFSAINAFLKLPKQLKSEVKKGWVQLFPHRHQTDGMFIACFFNKEEIL